MNFKNYLARITVIIAFAFVGAGLSACAQVNVPEARNVDIPNPIQAEKRRKAVNERPDSVVYLPLGEDVLVPARMVGGNLPNDQVGPFELRGETLAGALQLILADYDISIAFETDQGMTKKVTVANLKGPLNKVVERVCSLADLYCSYEDSAIVVKDTQTFTVTLPPLGGDDGNTEFITNIISGLTAVIGGSGSAPVSDTTTRTIIYSATHRTSKLAENYFQRLRANTAMIVFETYIWEVSLDAGNSTGIQWDRVGELGKFNSSISLNGAINGDFTNPVTIGLPTTSAIGEDPGQLVEFLSRFGAVKTISQPQITVLSGSTAELRVADTENYVSEVTQTISGDNTATSVSTDSVDSGFTLGVSSSWDKSTIYANVSVNLSNVDEIDNFVFDTDAGGGETTIQLPQTTERELNTQIRVRPGDSVLIAGLVREQDNFSSRGPGFMKPVLPDSRTAGTENLELVIMLRPRVIVYTAQGDRNHRGANHFGNQNRAENILQSSLQRRVTTEPAMIEPAAAPVRMPDPLDRVIQNVTAAPVVPAYAPPAPIAVSAPVPVYEAPPAPIVQRRVAPVAPVAPAPVVQPRVAPVISAPIRQPVSSVPVVQRPVVEPPVTVYSDTGYRPSGGLTRGQDLYSPTRQTTYAPVASPAVSARVPAPRVAPRIAPRITPEIAPEIAPVVTPQPSSSYSGPLSPNVYNNAEKIDVYDLYHGG